MKRRVLAVSIVVLGGVLAACVPPPTEPSPPRWRATVQTWGTGPDGPVERPYTATSEDWWAVVEVVPDFTSARLLLFPRTGPGGAPAAAPAHAFELPQGATDLAMDDHVLAVTPRQAVGDEFHVALFELDGGAWSPAGTVPRPMDAQRNGTIAVTDSHLVLAERAPGDPLEADGTVVVLPIDLSGPGISWSAGDVQTLFPDPTWPLNARTGFGTDLSIEGPLLAVGTDEDRVALYELTGAAWTLDEVLVSALPGSDASFGRALALDASGAARLAVGSSGGWVFGVPQAGRVEIYERGASGWTPTLTIGPRDGSGLNGLVMGSTVALDGDRLVQSGHWALVPGPTGNQVTDLRVEVHDLSASPTFRTELSTLDALGGVAALPTVTMIGAFDLDLAGDHLAMNVLASFGPDPTHHAAISYDLR